MLFWRENENGAREFTGGKESWSAAVDLARKCPSFALDVEEERVSDDLRSCYNCRYRRWTVSSFTCQAAGNCSARGEAT
jgi:hypothetical protein